jgi:1-acyl-sn-glycerol-3-phosphate acyltransferase
MLDRLITVFYWFMVRTWITLLMTIAARLDVKGMENLPKKGPVILVSNHFNTADPPVITYVLPRRIVWMAKQELFDTPAMGTVFRMLGLIPVRRFEADLKALRRHSKRQARPRARHVPVGYPQRWPRPDRGRARLGRHRAPHGSAHPARGDLGYRKRQTPARFLSRHAGKRAHR